MAHDNELGLTRSGLALAAWLLTVAAGMGDAWGASAPSAGVPALKGDAREGHRLFNGKGACAYCHGEDGYLGRMPPLESDTAALVARLNPPPADLRRPKGLRLKNDKARAKIVREGHEGTGMFPDTTLTDQQIADILAYLAVLRQEGPAKR